MNTTEHSDAPRSESDNSNKEGFTVVELLVAVIILAVGVLGLAGTSAVVLRQMSGGTSQSTAAQIAASRFENLAGNKCPTTAKSGTATYKGVTEAWSLTTADNKTVIAEVKVTIPDRTTTEQFKTVISCF